MNISVTELLPVAPHAMEELACSPIELPAEAAEAYQEGQAPAATGTYAYESAPVITRKKKGKKR